MAAVIYIGMLPTVGIFLRVGERLGATARVQLFRLRPTISTTSTCLTPATPLMLRLLLPLLPPPTKAAHLCGFAVGYTIDQLVRALSI